MAPRLARGTSRLSPPPLGILAPHLIPKFANTGGRVDGGRMIGGVAADVLGGTPMLFCAGGGGGAGGAKMAEACIGCGAAPGALGEVVMLADEVGRANGD